MADPFLVTVSAVLAGNGLTIMAYYGAREAMRDDNTGRRRSFKSYLWTLACVVIPAVFLVYGASLS